MKKIDRRLLPILAAVALSAIYAFAGLRVAFQAALVLSGAGMLYVLSRRRPQSAFARETVHKQTDVGSSALRFSDVAANEDAMRSLRQLVNYLKNPERYARLGARLPHGVLLYGPPGTGKTLMARALAGEAGVPFYPMNGSDFVEIYAGVGASRVRSTFEKARKAGRCVIFVDEIDALGKARSDRSSDEREQTLNALLSEMSGFRPSDGVIVLAATNRADTLDPALTRPGRFDRQIEVGLPDRKARLDILRLHARNKPLSDQVDMESLASATVQFSGASLEQLLNEAALLAAERNADCIGADDVNAALCRVVAGDDRPATASREELAQIALHEAGHAVATHLLLPGHRLMRLSILPSGKGAAGYNLTIPGETALPDRALLLKQIRILLAGRAAEMLLCPQRGLTAGAANDLSRAGKLAGSLVMDLGMGGEAAVCLRAVEEACGTHGGDSVQACRALLEEQMRQVGTLLGEHTSLLSALTETLLEEETMDEGRIAAFFHSFANSSVPAQAAR